tara:strand:+ start:2114 stop:2908 length:795 start_codon:yes stop_codon:yes gene_type:complete
LNSFLNKFSAFLVKDLKIALSYKFNLFIQLVMFLFIFITIYFAFQNPDLDNSNLSYFDIFLSLLSIDFMFSSLNIFSREVRLAKTAGTFETNLLTNTSFLTIIFSSYAVTFLRMMFRAFLYLLVCKFFFNFNLSLTQIFIVIISLYYNSVPFIALGLISASFIIVYKAGDITNFVISLLSIFFSGIFFPVSSLPSYMKSFGEVTPLNICLETSKKIIQDNFNFVDLLPYFKLTTVEIIIFLPIGLFFISKALKLAKKEGTLSYY